MGGRLLLGRTIQGITLEAAWSGATMASGGLTETGGVGVELTESWMAR
jgi:hypothetical protein